MASKLIEWDFRLLLLQLFFVSFLFIIYYLFIFLLGRLCYSTYIHGLDSGPNKRGPKKKKKTRILSPFCIHTYQKLHI